MNNSDLDRYLTEPPEFLEDDMERLFSIDDEK